MYKVVFWVWFLNLLVFYSTGEAQEKRTWPPPEVIQADRLVLSDLNFSIKSPGKDWIWHRAELGQQEGKKATVLTVDDPSDALRFIVLVWDRETRRAGPIDDTDWLIKGVQQGLGAGWRAATPQVSDSDVPLPGSMRFSTAVISPEGTKQYLFGYGTQGKRMYSLMAYGLSPVEPQSFSEMVKSFRILNPNDNLPKSSGVWWYILPLELVILGTMIVEICLAFRRRKSRRQADGPREDKTTENQNTEVVATTDVVPQTARGFKAWSAYLLVVGVIICFSLGLLRGGGPKESSQQIIALLFWPLLISYVLYGRSKRRDWNRFARWFFWLCLFNPAALVMMQTKP